MSLVPRQNARIRLISHVRTATSACQDEGKRPKVHLISRLSSVILNPGANMGKRELAQAIYKTAHITGEFKLRSGLTSKEYFDKYRFESQPALLKAIAQEMKGLVPKGTQVLAGLEM